MNKARRPLSSAASFFRSDGKKKESSPNRHESLSHPVTGISRPGLSASEAEKLELFDLFPTLVEYVRQNGLGEEGLFMKDPSAQTQEAMMGLAAGTPRIQVRALRRLLDARPEEREGVLNEFDVHVWAGAIKVAIKEMSRPIVPFLTVQEMLQIRDKDSAQGRIVLLQRIVSGMPPTERSHLGGLVSLLNECLTDKDKLGYVFAAALLLPHIPPDQTSNVEALSTAMKVMVTSYDDVFSGVASSSTASSSTFKPTTPYDNKTNGRYEYSSSAPPAPVPRPGAVAVSKPPPPLPLAATAAAIDYSANSNYSSKQEERVIYKVTCMYDFDPVEEDELELRVGDVIEIFSEGSDGWLRGRLTLPDGTQEIGSFPSNYVERLSSSNGGGEPVESRNEDEDETLKRLQHQFQSQTTSSSFSAASKVVPPSPPPPAAKIATFTTTPTYSSSSTHADEEYYHQQPDPSPNLFSSSLPPPPPAAVPQPVAAPLAPQQLENIPATALFDFEPEETGELKLVKGQRFTVLNRIDPDWWLGRTPDGRQGLFPHNYAQISNSIKDHHQGDDRDDDDDGAFVSSSSSQSGLQAVSSGIAALAAKPPPPPPPVHVSNSTSSAVQRTRPRPPAPPPPKPLLPPPSSSSSASSSSSSSDTHGDPFNVDDAKRYNWIVTADAFQKYVEFFEKQNKDDTGKVPGRDAATFLVQSGLPRPTIARILELSDLDLDKRFDRDEFAIAMHLSLCVSKRKMPLPDTLPPYLIPKSKRR